MPLHYAPDLNDGSETPCLSRVGALLMAGEDVTDNREGLVADVDACPDCKEAVEAEMGVEEGASE